MPPGNGGRGSENVLSRLTLKTQIWVNLKLCVEKRRWGGVGEEAGRGWVWIGDGWPFPVLCLAVTYMGVSNCPVVLWPVLTSVQDAWVWRVGAGAVPSCVLLARGVRRAAASPRLLQSRDAQGCVMLNPHLLRQPFASSRSWR